MEHDKRVGNNFRSRFCFYHPVEIRYVIKEPIAAPTLRAEATMASISFIVRSRSLLFSVLWKHLMLILAALSPNLVSLMNLPSYLMKPSSCSFIKVMSVVSE